MREPICSEEHNDAGRDAGRAPASERERADIDWKALLPRAWREQVVAPLEFEVFREYEIAAQRVRGLDEDGLPCYCAHQVQLQELRSDDDEEFYQVVTYAERLSAWRLRDGRWLIYRQVGGADCAAPLQGFYAFSDNMPR